MPFICRQQGNIHVARIDGIVCLSIFPIQPTCPIRANYWRLSQDGRQRANPKFAQALNVAEGYAHVFSESDISKCFYLLDDFHSSDRISGNQRIPLAKLVSGKKYIVEGQRLEVNPSVDRYKREMANLSAAL